jgi:hypothetical protein
VSGAVLSLLLIASQAESAGATDRDQAAGAEIQTPSPDVRLLDGAFQLHLNIGGFSARRASPEAEAAAPVEVGGGLDFAGRRGRLRIGGGDERRLRLAVQWDVELDHDMARVHSTIDLSLFGHELTLTPPDVRLKPRFDGGTTGLEVNVPILEGHF